MRKVKLSHVYDAAYRGGALLTHVADVAVFGTRHVFAHNSGDALERRPAIGVGKRSVYEGPIKIFGGAPIVKRPPTA